MLGYLRLKYENLTLYCLSNCRFAKLTRDEPVVYCSAMDLITCVGDIETAWNDCSSAGSVDDIFNCIEDIIGAGSDCMSCVCEVLGIC